MDVKSNRIRIELLIACGYMRMRSQRCCNCNMNAGAPYAIWGATLVLVNLQMPRGICSCFMMNCIIISQSLYDAHHNVINATCIMQGLASSISYTTVCAACRTRACSTAVITNATRIARARGSCHSIFSPCRLLH